MPRRRPTHDDAALWERVTQTVTPIKGRTVGTRAPNPEALEDRSLPEPGPPASRQAPAGRRRPEQHAMLPGLAHDKHPGVDKRMAQRLRKGQIAVEARIDLHGLTQAQAHASLNSFIADAQDAGQRCVLVITGKGLGPDGSIGVLRASVPRWLNTPPLRSKILAFAHAQRRHGGEGALYVLIKRRR